MHEALHDRFRGYERHLRLVSQLFLCPAKVLASYFQRVHSVLREAAAASQSSELLDTSVETLNPARLNDDFK